MQTMISHSPFPNDLSTLTVLTVVQSQLMSPSVYESYNATDHGVPFDFHPVDQQMGAIQSKLKVIETNET